MSKLQRAEETTRQNIQNRTDEMALALSVQLDAMRKARVSTSEELAKAMYPLLQAMTSLALENQVLFKELRSVLGSEMQQARAEMGELRLMMADLRMLLIAAKPAPNLNS